MIFKRRTQMSLHRKKDRALFLCFCVLYSGRFPNHTEQNVCISEYALNYLKNFIQKKPKPSPFSKIFNIKKFKYEHYMKQFSYQKYYFLICHPILRICHSVTCICHSVMCICHSCVSVIQLCVFNCVYLSFSCVYFSFNYVLII